MKEKKGLARQVEVKAKAVEDKIVALPTKTKLGLALAAAGLVGGGTYYALHSDEQAAPASDDGFPWTWAIGTFVVLGGLGYASYRFARAAAPHALHYYAPELLPHYEAWEKAGTPSAKRVALHHMISNLRDDGAATVRR